MANPMAWLEKKLRIPKLTLNSMWDPEKGIYPLKSV